MIKFPSLVILLLLFSINLVEGQISSDNWSVHLKYGIPFQENAEPTFSSFETGIKHYPLYHTTVGFSYQHFFTQGISLELGMSYELGSFSKVERYSYTAFSNETRSGKINERFLTHSLLYPIRIHYHIGRLGISAGWIPTLHLATKVSVNRTFWIDGVQTESYDIGPYEDGGRYTSGSGAQTDYISADLDRKINFQIALGFQYQISNHLILDVEIRQYLRENLLVKDHLHYDAGSVFTYYNPFPGIISVGLSYNLFRRS